MDYAIFGPLGEIGGSCLFFMGKGSYFGRHYIIFWTLRDIFMGRIDDHKTKIINN